MPSLSIIVIFLFICLLLMSSRAMLKIQHNIKVHKLQQDKPSTIKAIYNTFWEEKVNSETDSCADLFSVICAKYSSLCPEIDSNKDNFGTDTNFGKDANFDAQKTFTIGNLKECQQTLDFINNPNIPLTSSFIFGKQKKIVAKIPQFGDGAIIKTNIGDKRFVLGVHKILLEFIDQLDKSQISAIEKIMEDQHKQHQNFYQIKAINIDLPSQTTLDITELKKQYTRHKQLLIIDEITKNHQQFLTILRRILVITMFNMFDYISLRDKTFDAFNKSFVKNYSDNLIQALKVEDVALDSKLEDNILDKILVCLEREKQIFVEKKHFYQKNKHPLRSKMFDAYIEKYKTSFKKQSEELKKDENSKISEYVKVFVFFPTAQQVFEDMKINFQPQSKLLCDFVFDTTKNLPGGDDDVISCEQEGISDHNLFEFLTNKNLSIEEVYKFDVMKYFKTAKAKQQPAQ